MEQGWKLHISSRAATFTELVQALLPVLLKEGCTFKLARSRRVLSELNDGRTAPASVGKAVTIYPDQDRVRELGLTLADVLRGHEGPRVLSDRRVRSSAPVYYRYGPFVDTDRVPGYHGRLISSVYGPHGEWFDAGASLRYRQPSWARDPFTGQDAATGETTVTGRDAATGQDAAASADTGRPARLGERYRVIDGIREAAQGNVYRAIDESDSSAVIVKQGRAFVAEHDGCDARMRLRNERRVLRALAGTVGVPDLLDHFRQGEDEFLVTRDCGEATLVRQVTENGPYRSGTGAGAASVEVLATRLARIVRAMHERGVIMRDLSPNNVVIDGEDVTVIDFALSAFDGLHLPGGTAGYAPARQFRREPPREADDLHALGMTLLFAATGLDPVTLGQDGEDLPRIRALQAIHAKAGPHPTGIWADIADLLGEEGQAHDALRRLADGSRSAGRSRVRSARGLPAPVHGTPELFEEVTASLRADLLREAERILAGPPADHVPDDLNVYGGLSGIGLELVHHRDHEPARGLLAELARHTARAADDTRLPPGLFNGVTGVRVFLSDPRVRGNHDASEANPALPPLDWDAMGEDLIGGAAGLGLGHLCLARADGDPVHLDSARYCARVIARATERPALQPEARRVEYHALDPTAGAAHGQAGIVELFVALAEHTGDRADLDEAALRCRDLASRAESLMLTAGSHRAHPLSVSWCQGLAGVGRALLHGAKVLGDPSLCAVASCTADTCVGMLPRMPRLGQCCGAAGVGSLLIDLATHERDERYWDAAGQVADHLLLRSAGTPAHPVFTEPSRDSRAASWAIGIAGFLAFFRRLANRGGPDSIPLWGTAS